MVISRQLKVTLLQPVGNPPGNSMISIQQDPKNPDRLTLTANVTIYLDKVLDDVLSQEVASAIREQVIKDLAKKGTVRRAIQAAASQQLPAVLNAEAVAAIDNIKTQTATGTARE